MRASFARELSDLSDPTKQKSKPIDDRIRGSLRNFARDVMRKELKAMSDRMEETLCAEFRRYLAQDLDGVDMKAGASADFSSTHSMPSNSSTFGGKQSLDVYDSSISSWAVTPAMRSVPKSPQGTSSTTQVILEAENSPREIRGTTAFQRQESIGQPGRPKNKWMGKCRKGSVYQFDDSRPKSRIKSKEFSFPFSKSLRAPGAAMSSIRDTAGDRPQSSSYIALGNGAQPGEERFSQKVTTRRPGRVDTLDPGDAMVALPSNPFTSAGTEAQRRAISAPEVDGLPSESLATRTNRLSKDLGMDNVRSQSVLYPDDNVTESESECCGGASRRFLESYTFTVCIAVIIGLYAITIGVMTDYMARSWTDVVPMPFIILDNVFCFIFFCEMLLRLHVHGLSFFLSDDVSSCAWNWFDFVVLAVQIYDDWVNPFIHSGVRESKESKQFGSCLFAIRILRLLRLLRVARLINLLTELRTLIVSIMTSFKSVIWAFGLLSMIMYVVGIYFTQIVTAYKVDRGAHDSEELEDLYGSLSKSMITLFEAIASGISWKAAVDPLSDAGPYTKAWFLGYIAFTVFIVLNVVTGVFVGTATEKAKEDTKKVLMFQLRELFRKADSDHSGVMNWDKFLLNLQDPYLQNYLKVVDLDQTEAYDLFVLLDSDDSDAIDEVEFVNGCLQLHGTAKAIELATLTREINIHVKACADNSLRVDDNFARLFAMIPEEQKDLRFTQKS